MATLTASILPSAVEARVFVGPFPTVGTAIVTPIMLAFDAMLISVRKFIAAERDLVGIDLWDIACRAWLNEAEDTQTLMTGRIRAVRELPQVLACDRPLKRMALLLDLMLGTATRSDLAHAHGLLNRYSILFACSDNDPVADRVNDQLMRGRTLIAALVALPLYPDPYDTRTAQSHPRGALPEVDDAETFELTA
jgi:hypothetical protein